MSETSAIILAMLAGSLLGTVFFGGLWWTIQRSVGVQWAGSSVWQQFSDPNGHCCCRVLFRLSWRLAESGGLPGWLSSCAHLRNADHAAAE